MLESQFSQVYKQVSMIQMSPHLDYVMRAVTELLIPA